MKTITVELTPEMAEQMLPALERQKRLAEEQVAKISEQIDRIKNALRPEKTEPLFTPKLARATTESGRAKKGETEKIVAEYLRGVNGQGAKVVTISEKTETKYGSVRRVLKDLMEKGNAEIRDGLWFWTE